MATTYLTRTATANNNSVGKWTFSCWIKRHKLGVETNIISFYSTGSYRSALRFDSDDKVKFYEVWNGSTIVAKVTNRLFRDTNAWYHLVLAVDKTVSSPSTQIYVNGEAITSWSTDSDYTQNESGKFNDAEPIYINAESSVNGGTNVQDISMSHVHFVDGTTYAASDFGSTDSTTGEWKINTSPTVTYGTNGFFILKDGNSVTDQSGNSNNFTVAAGTLTNTEDCPSNVFATMSPLHKGSNVALTNGNLTCTGSGSNASVASTLAVSTGKWYWEAKLNSSTNNYFNVGILKSDVRIDNLAFPGDVADGYVYAVDGNIYRSGSSLLSTGTTLSVGNIVGFLLDLDNGTLKLKVNGSDVYSGNAVVSSLNTGDFWYVAQGANPSSVDINFGNGYFGTTAISSEGTNASGIGKFEYDVPTGYTALSTKGLNE
jgi:hypothetical protein